MLVYWSMDVQSFEAQSGTLNSQVHNLKRLGLSLAQRYPFLQFRFMFGSGISSTFRRSLKMCDESVWCQYVVFLEDDWLFEHTCVQQSLTEIMQILDTHTFMNYLRFNGAISRDNWDSPCLVSEERVTGATKFLKGAGFSNNPHVSRASVMRKLFDVVYDHDQFGSEGVEHDYGNLHGAAFLHALCSTLAVECRSEVPFHISSSDCDSLDWRTGSIWTKKEKWRNEFINNGTDCVTEQGESPVYDHCGLYLFSDEADCPRASHLDGNNSANIISATLYTPNFCSRGSCDKQCRRKAAVKEVTETEATPSAPCNTAAQ